MKVVNGYYCQNCTQELAAQKGIDPAKSNDPLVKAGQSVLRTADGASAANSGALQQTVYGVNRPDASKSVGSKLSMYA